MGIDHVVITEKPLSLEALVAKVGAHSCGAISVFIGTTRDNFQGKRVARLEYEGYIPMAEKELLKICNQIRDKWTVEAIAIEHRIGLVPIGEASVIIAVSSPHRRESLSAVDFAIETLKATVPIWKKEVYIEGDGEPVWKENCE
eukprot:Colp12_sorted_trinity150504_noHs@31445